MTSSGLRFASGSGSSSTTASTSSTARPRPRRDGSGSVFGVRVPSERCRRARQRSPSTRRPPPFRPRTLRVLAGPRQPSSSRAVSFSLAQQPRPRPHRPASVSPLGDLVLVHAGSDDHQIGLASARPSSIGLGVLRRPPWSSESGSQRPPSPVLASSASWHPATRPPPTPSLPGLRPRPSAVGKSRPSTSGGLDQSVFSASASAPVSPTASESSDSCSPATVAAARMPHPWPPDEDPQPPSANDSSSAASSGCLPYRLYRILPALGGAGSTPPHR